MLRGSFQPHGRPGSSAAQCSTKERAEIVEHRPLDVGRQSAVAMREVDVDPAIRVVAELPCILGLVELGSGEEAGLAKDASDHPRPRAAGRADHGRARVEQALRKGQW